QAESAEGMCWISRHDIQAAFGPNFKVERGIGIVGVVGAENAQPGCMFLHHEQQPLFQASNLACLYCDAAEATALTAPLGGTAAVPVFWGQGGGEALQRFLGWYRSVEILPRDHAAYQDAQLLRFMEELASRSRRSSTFHQGSELCAPADGSSGS
ncbi:unnamed protein product, partial [Cladocopium goreaui]